jgi:DNA-binding response OmpR family regulator
MKVLLIEDNERLAERIQFKLRTTFIIDSVHTAAEALDQIEQVDYGIIVLDIGLPDMNGRELCALIRAKYDIPILALTGFQDIATRVEMLDLGADDYVCKPFDIQELRARMHALARRRSKPKITQLLAYKDLQVNTMTHEVTRAGVSITLRRKEFEILEYLLTNQGRIITRKMIMDHVWNADTKSWLTTVDVHIKHLRDKIDKPFEQSYIKTIYGLGYKLEASATT